MLERQIRNGNRHPSCRCSFTSSVHVILEYLSVYRCYHRSSLLRAKSSVRQQQGSARDRVRLPDVPELEIWRQHPRRSPGRRKPQMALPRREARMAAQPTLPPSSNSNVGMFRRKFRIRTTGAHPAFKPLRPTKYQDIEAFLTSEASLQCLLIRAKRPELDAAPSRLICASYSKRERLRTARGNEASLWCSPGLP